MQDRDDLIREEDRRIRLLRMASDLLVHVLMTRPISLSEADKMIQGTRNLALRLFPDKGHVFDLIHMPRFRRALREAGAYDSPRTLNVLIGGKMPKTPE
ncbi:MAG: hypothetical protein HY913_18550 [Desulfomonile tiedjei]|nr:hypothetical protein [Desulfomonile tiedjei]